MTTTTPQEIEDTVRAIVAESLAIPASDVPPTVSLIGELGAESLDFLDIVFKLERTYGIQVTRGELERAARGDMSDDEFAPGGVISEAGLARLRELMPEVAGQIKPGLHPGQILGLFTVQTFVHLVVGKLAQRSANVA
ncbi:acyl carrier protein [Massilia atriviolacea]|uniref:Acyl carrier protein n=1 Tax=Massilia atriviolacea TaxID=2495579 RepID=A0A430HQB9_9BURK|nr:acyl carrier protein [Massilia atriviolacea]RSZ59721.1 acyl carrier protein [Massilia atriviolacea]